MKHLLRLEDWSSEQITKTLNLADQLKYEQKHGIEHKLLAGKTLGMIFEKSSTRTRVSFEVGMTQLGGYPLFLSSNDLQIGRGEPVEDTARVLSRFLDAIMIRTFEQSEVEALAEYGSIPIINGLTDYCHPCQVLADLMTIRENQGTIDRMARPWCLTEKDNSHSFDRLEELAHIFRRFNVTRTTIKSLGMDWENSTETGYTSMERVYGHHKGLKEEISKLKWNKEQLMKAVYDLSEVYDLWFAEV